ncbi:hydantoinase B/oxoprolinase family protein [Paenibacillus sp. GXUN7292]|uniref:hydantoinase B/oxoprolinase family protein n=1 Tax=Paenibacillus sp. GXUN7292 TaxID=3422499 RepID=UPI003D7E115C
MSGRIESAGAAGRIREQIIYGKLAAINLHASERIQRIARSPLIAESRRLAVAILTPDVQLAHQIQFEVEHMYALCESVRSALDFFAYDIAEGDVIVTADAYGGGTRGQTLTMIMPLFVEGELVLFPAIRAQMSDLGGEIPGGFHPLAHEQWQESMRLTPVKLYVGGKLQRDVFRFLMTNSRTAEWLGADLGALYACCQEMQRALLELLGQYGAVAVSQAAAAMIAHTEAQARRFLIQHGSAASGQSAAELPAECGSGRVLVTAFWSGDQLVLDFSGTAGQLAAPYNSTEAMTKSVAAAAALAGCLDELPINDGLLAALEFKLPEGSLVAPRFPAATALSGHVTAHAIAAAVTAALRQATGASGDSYPTIHGGSTWAMLYHPVGSAKVTPFLFEPGFAEVTEGWGPSALFGSGRLLSAEELESGYGFRLEKRERQSDGSMQVELHILNGKWEYQAFSYGEESIHIDRWHSQGTGGNTGGVLENDAGVAAVGDAGESDETGRIEQAISFGGPVLTSGDVIRMSYAGGTAVREEKEYGN